jgi:hypothetical protein
VSPEKVTVGMVQVTLAGGSAVPVSPTCCGVPLALSATFSVAVSAPVELGVNVTLIMQLPPAATLEPHDGLTCAKSAAFAPKMLMPMPVPVMLSAALPVLESVTVCAGEVVPLTSGAKTSKVVLRLAMGAGGAIVREKSAEKLRPAESVTITLTEVVPDTVGVPERTPPVDMFSPEGSPAAAHLYGEVPPLASNVMAVYGTPSIPGGNGLVAVMIGPVVTLTVSVTVTGSESTTSGKVSVSDTVMVSMSVTCAGAEVAALMVSE